MPVFQVSAILLPLQETTLKVFRISCVTASVRTSWRRHNIEKFLYPARLPASAAQVNPNHIVQDFVAICQELEPPCHQSSICLLLPPICQQVWEQAKLSWYGSLGHGCENFYIVPIPTQALRQGDNALVSIYTFSTQLQFRSRYWDIEVSQTQIGSCYVLSSLSLQLHADILDFNKTIELDGMVFVWQGAVKSWEPETKHLKWLRTVFYGKSEQNIRCSSAGHGVVFK